MHDGTEDQIADQTEQPSPLKAIRQHCLSCCRGSFAEVRACSATACPLYAFRLGRKPDTDTLAELERIPANPVELGKLATNVASGSRLRAIRARCIDCSGNLLPEIKGCAETKCALHPYRMGKSGRVLRPEQRVALAERLKQARVAG